MIGEAENDLFSGLQHPKNPFEKLHKMHRQTIDDIPIIDIVNTMIAEAIKDRASDIHIEPTTEILRIRFRVDGLLREFYSVPMKIHALMISRIKIMSALDIAEKRLPQDGRIAYSDGQKEVDLRVSTMPTVLGEKIVMRILDKSNCILDMRALGFSAENLQAYDQLYRQAYGMILITGPTSSGKTTTLYSTLTSLNTLHENTITIEDPVEYHLNGINQVQVNPKAGLTFALGLRSILRQDPDILMVGEIRDNETANIAVRAALTGHLVFSTLHTNDAAGAISRLIDMDVEPFLVASSVLGILAQRLVRRICPSCKEAYSPEGDAAERAFMGQQYDQEALVLYRGKGCIKCGNTGYYGRLAIHELLPISKEIRTLIHRRASADRLKECARKEGMKTMFEDGMEKVLAGQTTLSEIARAACADVTA